MTLFPGRDSSKGSGHQPPSSCFYLCPSFLSPFELMHLGLLTSQKSHSLRVVLFEQLCSPPQVHWTVLVCPPQSLQIPVKRNFGGRGSPVPPLTSTLAASSSTLSNEVTCLLELLKTPSLYCTCICLPVTSSHGSCPVVWSNME